MSQPYSLGRKPQSSTTRALVLSTGFLGLCVASARSQAITLQSQANSAYLAVSSAGKVTASASTSSAASDFERLYIGNGFFALKDTKTGRYLSVQNTGSFNVSAAATTVGPSEEFSSASQAANSVAILSRINNQYLTVDTAAGNTLEAISTSVAAAQTFTLTVANPNEAVQGSINTTIKHQSITGFGGAEYFYNNFLTANPHSAEIYQALFDPVQGLGVNLLRLGNVYAGTSGNFDPDSQAIVQNATAYYGSSPIILMSAWSPPAYLKSNNNTTGGTLRKINGAYDYPSYGQWWHDSIDAYRALGINPAYVSIQNESDAVVGYISNSFNPSEKPYNGNQYAGYDKALDAVHASFAKLSDPPALVGPETQGIGYNTFQDYVNALTQRYLGAIAEHLYTGGDPGQPDTFNTDMIALDEQFPNKPKFDTEYYSSSAFNYAWIMHNALVSQEVSAYLYWALAWPDTQSGLIYLDNPYNAPSTWTHPHGWAPNDQYYAFKHFSYSIYPGYQRVDAVVNDPDIKLSAYEDPKKTAGAVVVLNTSATRTITFAVYAPGVKVSTSHVYRSTFSNNSTERWRDLGSLPSGNKVQLPPQSIATISVNQDHR